MTKSVRIRLSLLLVILCRGQLSAQIEELFAGVKSAAPQGGLVLEIALPKETYFFFESSTIYGRFSNVTADPIALTLEERGSLCIEARLRWEFSSPDGKQHSPSVRGSTVPNLFLIPPHERVYFALPDKMFPVGTTRMTLEYSYFEESKQPPVAAIEVWQGRVRSNELEVVVRDKDILTPEERVVVDEKIRRHIELFDSIEWYDRYQAEHHLARMARYSVPILVECLKHKSARVRESAINTLARIADKRLAEEKGFERDISFLDELLLTYDRERDPSLKRRVVSALGFFDDVEPEKRSRIAEKLRTAIDHTDKSLRTMSAIVLLEIDKRDGIAVVIGKMQDKTYFGEEGQGTVIEALQKKTGQSFGPSSSKWEKWWQENKGKIKDD